MAKKLKKDEELCSFQPKWTEKCAFVQRARSAVCLICINKNSISSEGQLKGGMPTATMQSARVQANQQQLCVRTRQGDWNSASFAGALAIVRNGKPLLGRIPNVYAQCNRGTFWSTFHTKIR